MMTAELLNGPLTGVKYPLKVHYCGECSLPLEYCEYFPSQDKCRLWMEKNLPEMFESMVKTSVGADDDKKGRQKRGGKALPKAKRTAERYVRLGRSNRGKKKFVTIVLGLSTFDIDLKEAAKFFASKFACGSSVTGTDEIVIQGDVKDDLFDIICEKWNEIDEDSIEDIGDVKK